MESLTTRREHRKISRELSAEYLMYSEDVTDECGTRRGYSLSVTLYKNGNISEEAKASDISTSVSEAHRIFSLVADGMATPMTLGDVISDLLSE